LCPGVKEGARLLPMTRGTAVSPGMGPGCLVLLWAEQGFCIHSGKMSAGDDVLLAV